jgi:DNA-binding NarL/FixJ family response regulator
VRTVARRCCYVPVPSDRSPRPATERSTSAARLSNRERQAMGLIAQGFTHQQIARRMGIAKSTVETYVERIREKLQLGNKAQLAVAAIGILHSD